MSTHDQDLKLKVGTELDAEVWRRLFGYTLLVALEEGKVFREYEVQHARGGVWLSRDLLPPLSTDIVGAWTVVEELRTRGWLWTIKEMPDGFPYFWEADFREGSKIWRRSIASLEYMPDKTVEDGHKRIWMHPMGMGASVPEAICRAALMALEEAANCPCKRSDWLQGALVKAGMQGHGAAGQP